MTKLAAQNSRPFLRNYVNLLKLSTFNLEATVDALGRENEIYPSHFPYVKWYCKILSFILQKIPSLKSSCFGLKLKEILH